MDSKQHVTKTKAPSEFSSYNFNSKNMDITGVKLLAGSYTVSFSYYPEGFRSTIYRF